MSHNGKDINGCHIGAQFEYQYGRRVVRLYRGADGEQEPVELASIPLDELLDIAHCSLRNWRNRKGELELPPEVIRFLWSLRSFFEVAPAFYPRTPQLIAGCPEDDRPRHFWPDAQARSEQRMAELRLDELDEFGR